MFFAFLWLQNSAVEIGSGVLSLGTFAMVLNLSFRAGRLVQKVEDIDSRLMHVETDGCPADNCPVRKEALGNKA